ncbi:MAG: ABC transporter permease [Silicimonas sp.]|nr:ABC transporter permease [Silicimonas sp.]
MFTAHQNTSLFYGAFRLIELIYHNTVRTVRKGHRDAVFAILANIMQTLVMIAAFYLFIDLMGMRGMAIRGDFLLYIMSGIFVFMVNVKAMGSVASAEGPTSAMMQHLPMNTTISLWSSALSALYTQLVAMFAILAGYHLLWNPLVIDDPVGSFAMIMLAWFNGCSIGMVLLALKPWFPRATAVTQQIYTRFNMFASGKMFVANMLPVTLVGFFSWNPLFHIIDQGRGYIFINYNPLKSSLSYPIIVSVVLLVIGLLGESQTRKHASLSWTAGK